MKRVITVSRYTDVPAFYGSWFMNRVAEGFAGWAPSGGPRQLVSLRREDVLVFVFWSRNYRPFLMHLRKLRELHYPCLFHISITVLPPELDRGTMAPEHIVDATKQIAAWFSPGQVVWRYEPILVTERTPPDYHVHLFTRLASALRGSVSGVQIRFLVRNRENEINCQRYERETGLELLELPEGERRALARRLAAIAAWHGMPLRACCDPTLVGGPVQPGCCLNRDLLARIGGEPDWAGEPGNRQAGCGCVASVDIGAAGTCPHGCFHCLDTVNKPRAALAYRKHAAFSAFLDLSKAESDRVVGEVRASEQGGCLPAPGRQGAPGTATGSSPASS